MTILFMDSGQYVDTTYLRQRWTYGDPVIETGVYRHGNRSITASMGYDSGLPFTLTTGVYLGASFYINTTLVNAAWYDCIMGLAYGTTGMHAHFIPDSQGYLKAYAGFNSTPIQTTSNPVVSAYSWHYAELYCYSDASSGIVRLWIDDSLVIEQTGLNTVSGTAGNQAAIFGSHNGHFDVHFQDIVISTTRMGPCKVSAYDVDSDETYTDWAALGAGNHYAEVDDATPDGDSSYNEGDAEGEKDSYGVTAESLDTIYAVQVKSFVKRGADFTPGRFRHFIRQGGSDYNASEEKTVTGAYAPYMDMWTLDPSDSNPWTQAKIESAEFGLEVTQLGTTTTTT